MSPHLQVKLLWTDTYMCTQIAREMLKRWIKCCHLPVAYKSRLHQNVLNNTETILRRCLPYLRGIVLGEERQTSEAENRYNPRQSISSAVNHWHCGVFFIWLSSLYLRVVFHALSIDYLLCCFISLPCFINALTHSQHTTKQEHILCEHTPGWKAFFL